MYLCAVFLVFSNEVAVLTVVLTVVLTECWLSVDWVLTVTCSPRQCFCERGCWKGLFWLPGQAKPAPARPCLAQTSPAQPWPDQPSLHQKPVPESSHKAISEHFAEVEDRPDTPENLQKRNACMTSTHTLSKTFTLKKKATSCANSNNKMNLLLIMIKTILQIN